MEELTLIAEQWLKAVAYTVATNDVAAHLDLFSRHLKVVGIRHHALMPHKEWEKRRRNDMEKRRLLRISHEQLRLVSHSRRRLTFQVDETLKSTLGECYVLSKEVTLEQELDNQWRAIAETINNVRPIRRERPSATDPVAPQPSDEATPL